MKEKEINSNKSFLKKITSGKRKYVLIFVLIVVGFLIYRKTLVNNEFESTKIIRGDVREELVLSGEIKAEKHANLTFQTSGELDNLNIEEGSIVKKGEVLASLNKTILYQAYLQAEANLRKYEATLDSTYDSVQGHANNESYAQRDTRTSAEVAKDNAYRSLVSAQQNLANASLRAPFDGVVTNVYIPFTGVNTTFSQPQIEVVDPETIYFEVSADQTEITDLKPNQKVIIVLDSYTDEEIEGSIEFLGITPKEGEVGAVYEVKVRIENGSLDLNKFKIGMTGDAKFVISNKSDVLNVPPNFVQADANGRYLLLGKPDNKVYIEVGVEGEDGVEIVSGDVLEGDMVYD